MWKEISDIVYGGTFTDSANRGSQNIAGTALTRHKAQGRPASYLYSQEHCWHPTQTKYLKKNRSNKKSGETLYLGSCLFVWLFGCF